MTDDLDSVLGALRVPDEYARYANIVEDDVLARLEGWKNRVEGELGRLGKIVDGQTLSVREQARVVCAVAAFDGEGVWVSTGSLDASRGLLEGFSPPTTALLECLLTQEIKPLFRSNPHPSIHESTGRRLGRPAGGPMATQDYYEGQTWKHHAGVGNVVLWCLQHIQAVDYERLWHLVIPPVMTYLDDYEAGYKLQGVQMVSEMLRRVPGDVLRRTGMDSLMHSSLTTCLQWLQNPETPAIIRAVVPTMLALIRASTAPGSAERFERLCALLGDGIIGTVWVYGSGDVETMVASVEVLPAVVGELGIGSARYLKVLVTQLVHGLGQDRSPELSARSGEGLESVALACGPRIERWRGVIERARG